MNVKQITDSTFSKYGKVLHGYDGTQLFKVMEHTPVPDDVIYVPSDEQLESLSIAQELKNRAYGGLPIQIGYCNGNNHMLNALEYHRSSEVNIAITDLVLLLGKQQDITKENLYETAKVEAFFVPAGTMIEVYATTLHYAPCNAEDTKGFQCVVVLPQGTNTEMDFSLLGEDDDKLMTAKNKWLIAHEEAKIEGAYVGLIGDNLTV